MWERFSIAMPGRSRLQAAPTKVSSMHVGAIFNRDARQIAAASRFHKVS
jgi:hypothetical protein